MINPLKSLNNSTFPCTLPFQCETAAGKGSSSNSGSPRQSENGQECKLSSCNKRSSYIRAWIKSCQINFGKVYHRSTMSARNSCTTTTSTRSRKCSRRLRCSIRRKYTTWWSPISPKCPKATRERCLKSCGSTYARHTRIQTSTTSKLIP